MEKSNIAFVEGENMILCTMQNELSMMENQVNCKRNENIDVLFSTLNLFQFLLTVNV